MKTPIYTKIIIGFYAVILFLLIFSSFASAYFEEDFDNLDDWTTDAGTFTIDGGRAEASANIRGTQLTRDTTINIPDDEDWEILIYSEARYVNVYCFSSSGGCLNPAGSGDFRLIPYMFDFTTLNRFDYQTSGGTCSIPVSDAYTSALPMWIKVEYIASEDKLYFYSSYIDAETWTTIGNCANEQGGVKGITDANKYISMYNDNSDTTARPNTNWFDYFYYTRPAALDFELTASNLFNSSNVTSFSASINNGTATQTTVTTNGTIFYTYVGHYANITIYNVTGSEGVYFNKSYTNYNVTTNLNASLYQADLTIDAYDGLNIVDIENFNCTINDSAYSQFNTSALNLTTFKANADTYTYSCKAEDFGLNQSGTIALTSLQTSSIQVNFTLAGINTYGPFNSTTAFDRVTITADCVVNTYINISRNATSFEVLSDTGYHDFPELGYGFYLQIDADQCSWVSLSTSVIPLTVDFTLKLENASANRKYEFGTNATIFMGTNDTAIEYCLNVSVSKYGSNYVCSATNQTLELPLNFLEYKTLDNGSSTQNMDFDVAGITTSAVDIVASESTQLGSTYNFVGNTNLYCYQESANESDQTGIDGSCGLDYSGNYSFDGEPFTNPNNAIDGNWDTFAKGDSVFIGEWSTLYVNYTKPTGAISGLFQIAPCDDLGVNKTLNITVPSICFNANSSILSFRLVLNSFSAGSGTYQCWNSSNWQQIGEGGEQDGNIQEEAMWWNIRNITYNYSGNYSTTNPNYLFNDGDYSTYTLNNNHQCYQGLSNVSTACGGVALSTGAYYNDSSRWQVGHEAYYAWDGDWDTYAQDDSAEVGSSLFINYTVPNNQIGEPLFQARTAFGGTRINYSLSAIAPDICWDAAVASGVLRIQIDTTGPPWSDVNGFCWYGSGFVAFMSTAADSFYEGAMWWNISTGNIEVKINYTKDSSFKTPSVWQVKDTLGITNLTLTESCFEQSPLQLKVNVSSTKVNWYCYDSSWVNLRSSIGGEIYDNSMWFLNKTALGITNTTKINDSDYDTFAYPSVSGNDTYFYANYTKLTNYSRTDSELEIKDNAGVINLTVPLACWDKYSDTLSFRVRAKTVDSTSPEEGAGVELECYGTDWTSIQDTTIAYDTVARIYELSFYSATSEDTSLSINAYEYDDLEDNLIINLEGTDAEDLTISYDGQLLFDFLYPFDGLYVIANETSDGLATKSLSYAGKEELSLGLTIPTFSIPPNTQLCSINISGLEANNETFRYYESFKNDTYIWDYDNDNSHSWVWESFDSTSRESSWTKSTNTVVDSNPSTPTCTYSNTGYSFDTTNGWIGVQQATSCTSFSGVEDQSTGVTVTANGNYNGNIDISDHDYIKIYYYSYIKTATSGGNAYWSSVAKGTTRLRLLEKDGTQHVIQDIAKSSSSTGHSDSDTDTTNTYYELIRAENASIYALYKTGVFVKNINYEDGEQLFLYVYASSESSGEPATSVSSSVSTINRITKIEFGGFSMNYTGTGTLYDTNTDFTTTNLNSFTEGWRTILFNADIYKPSGSTISFNVSNDNSTWKTANPGFVTSFTSYGTDLYVQGSINRGTYTGVDMPNIRSYTVEVLDVYPSNVSIDFGGEGTYEYNYTTELNSTVSPLKADFICSEMMTQSTSYCNSTQCTNLPIIIKSDTAGIIQIDAINFKSDASQITFDKDTFSADIIANPSTIDIDFAGSSGSVEVNNISFEYTGNGNITFTLYKDNYDDSESLTGIVRYSDYTLDLPDNINYLEFIPSTQTAKNVQPYGQTESKPIFNFTSDNGIDDMNLTMLIDDSNTCVDLMFNTHFNSSNSTVLTADTWNDLFTDEATDYSQSVWLWANFSCSNTGWIVFDPTWYFRGCVSNGKCSEALS